MNNAKLVKILGLVATAVGMGATLLTDWVNEKKMEEKIDGMSFCRGNKGYLINLQHVDSVQDGCAVVRGEQLVLSRARKKEFMECLTEYWGEMIK